MNDKELIDYPLKRIQDGIQANPTLHKFIHLFDRNKDVEFIDRSYSESVNHSSLMITDYSSVFFDFAYLKKPLIYYHYGKDYHFDVEAGYLTMRNGIRSCCKTYDVL